MFAKINFHDEFYQKLKLLVLPITMQQFMLALVSATDAIMLGAVSQTSLSAVSLAGQIQFVLNLFIRGISAGSGIMSAVRSPCLRRWHPRCSCAFLRPILR